MELGTGFLRKHLNTAFEMPDINQARRFLDSIELRLPMHDGVKRTPVTQPGFRGEWFELENHSSAATLLYFHGGGYTFYPRSYSFFLQLMTKATQARLLALDYRLAPEHRFPAQLDDAIAAYSWLLNEGTQPEKLIIAGDSAGAHLALGCLLRARDLNLPMPALAIALSPPTDLETDWPSYELNAPYDWIQKPMLNTWADYFCSVSERKNPCISLINANLSNLCPIYIQCGSAEILYDSIQAFGARGQAEGAQITIESWPDMNHVFQLFGPALAQSRQALSQIGKATQAAILAADHSKPRLVAERE
ncbi:MAG TPA: alpha/beta hydrolase [Terriglobales bacterium]|nr:alpha/beta hydrolase [Terriglobales bacterium]